MAARLSRLSPLVQWTDFVNRINLSHDTENEMKNGPCLWLWLLTEMLKITTQCISSDVDCKGWLCGLKTQNGSGACRE